MRFLCLLVTMIAAVVSVVLGFMTLNANNYIEKNTATYEEYKSKTEDINAEIVNYQTQIAALTEERDTLKAEVDLLTLQDHYTKNYTAFLTFDDGTSAQTLEILDILKEYNIKATFFVITSNIRTRGEKAREAVKRIVEEGHILAIHAEDHTYSKIYSSEQAYFDDFNTAIEYLATITDYKPTIVRLPSGTLSARDFCAYYGGSTDVYYDIVSRLYGDGYTVIDWNVDSQDWASSTSQQIIDNVIKGAKARKTSKYKNAVILMHEYNRTVEALPTIIESLKDLDYNFDNIDNLIKAQLVTRQVAATSKP